MEKWNGSASGGRIRALEMGADFIELDLQLTRDGVLIVMHDPTLDRTARPMEASVPADCTGPVISRTLEQVFRRCGRNTNYYIETKSPEQAPGMEEELLRLVGKHRLIGPPGESRRVLVQSFSREPAEDP